MLFRERSARGRFQVSFELDRPSSIGKCNVGFQTPRFPFRRVTNTPRIVNLESFTQITGQPRVETLSVNFALQDVNVEELKHIGLPSRSSPRLRPQGQKVRLR